NRPVYECLVVSPRRAVIIVDLAATGAIFPVPTMARVLRRLFQLRLGDVGAVPTKAGVIVEGGPGDRIVVTAEAQEAAKAEHGIGHLATALVDHDTLDGTHFLTFGVIDNCTFHFVAADEACSLPRFYCHGITPHDCKVTLLLQIHRTCTP